MRKFDLIKKSKNLINNNIVNLLSSIHEYKGKQELYRNLYKYSEISYVDIFKNSQNYIEETLENGTRNKRKYYDSLEGI